MRHDDFSLNILSSFQYHILNIDQEKRGTTCDPYIFAGNEVNKGINYFVKKFLHFFPLSVLAWVPICEDFVKKKEKNKIKRN